MVAVDDNLLQIIHRARMGDRQSLEVLALRVQERILPYIVRLVQDRDVRWDILQETQLIMIRSLTNLKRQECFWPWIYRIAYNTVQQHYRDRGRCPAVLMSDLDHAGLWGNEDQVAGEGLNGMIQAEKRHRLRGAVGRLRQKYRRVVQLRCFEQMSYTGIARLVQCSPQQARVRFHRAKNLLREHLAPLNI